VDREYYVMQGEFYTKGRTMQAGHQPYDPEKARDERPEYVVFNGRMGSLLQKGALTAKVGETVRLFVGNGGPNLISSFHVIGEVFDAVYAEGGIGGTPNRNVQTTMIPAGGAAIVQFKVDQPGRYLLVDHSLYRAMEKGAVGSLEVAGAATPGIFTPLESFPSVADYTRGTRLELGDYDAARGDDKFRLRGFGDARVPIERLYADVYLWRNAANEKYFITMVNRLNPQDPNSPAHLEIKLLYGGAVHDQRYIVSVPPGLGDRQAWYTVLRYNMTGRDNRLHRERRVWQDYKFYLWWSAGADSRYGTPDDVLTAPPVNNNAAQTMCAGCHLTGWERYQDKATDQFLVRAVNDPAGEMNIDDDPEPDEINIGCESCHGPGSEHVANGGRSRFIVNPRYLSAERSSVVCGRCHDRRQGYGGAYAGYTQAVNKAGALARPGISRHTLITEYTDPAKKGPTMRGPGREDNIWPDDVHSNKPHQQYSDFLKSKMYRNDRLLVTCSDCHDMHGNTPYPRWLVHDPDDSASPLCQRCHTVNVLTHMETKLNAKMKGELTRCIDCHMPGTANTGGIAGSFGRMIKTPPYANAQEEENNAYWQSPLKSHVFDVPLKTNVAVAGVPPGRAMPIPYTSSCGTCHVVNELPFR